MRSWRFQPTARSAAIRAPQDSIALIVPKATIPTMKYIGAEMPVPPRLRVSRVEPAIRKNRTKGNPSESTKKRRLRSVRNSS